MNAFAHTSCGTSIQGRIQAAIDNGLIDFVEVIIGSHFAQARSDQVAWLRSRCPEFDSQGLNEAVVAVYAELFRIADNDPALFMQIRPEIGPMTGWTASTVTLVRERERFCGAAIVG